MSIYTYVREKFVEEIGPPICEKSLQVYVDFVITKSTKKKHESVYCEEHHIIPRCLYENDLKFTLTYTDHVQAHLLLVHAYPISIFVRPLNFMLNRDEKETANFRKFHSIAIKTSWVSFKKSSKYIKWLEKHRKYGKSKQNKETIKLMNERNKTPEARRKQKDSLKEWWTTERKTKKSADIIEYNKQHGTERYTTALLERWESMSKEDYESFCKKMEIVNGCEEKRKNAGEKIKILWNENEEFQNKMKHRRKRGSDGSKSKKNWENPEIRDKILTKRKATYIKRNIPKRLLHEIENMSDDELIGKYGKYSKKGIDDKISNTELKNRLEVHIIKEYKKNFFIKKCPRTNRGWYRFNREKLTEIIRFYHEIYGDIEKYNTEIRGILNETK